MLYKSKKINAFSFFFCRIIKKIKIKYTFSVEFELFKRIENN